MISVNAVAMTLFAWHMTALVAVLGLARVAGYEPPTEPTAAWWVQRPLWLVAPGSRARALRVAVRPGWSWPAGHGWRRCGGLLTWTSPRVLLDIYGRVPHLAEEAVEGLDAGQLVERPAPDANTIAWLIWHLARVQDQQFADLLGTNSCGRPGTGPAGSASTADPSDNGYGHTTEQVGAVRPDGPAALLDYLAAVHEQTSSYLSGLTAEDLDRVIDEAWDPPVTLGVRLVSVADDCLQHAGQAAYIRGLLTR